MRSQAIEKLAKKICKQFQSLDTSRDPVMTTKWMELGNSVQKMEILTDRSNGDRAASVIREVMNQ